MSGQPLRVLPDKEHKRYTEAQRRHYRALARAAQIRAVDNADNRQKAAWAARTLR